MILGEKPCSFVPARPAALAEIAERIGHLPSEVSAAGHNVTRRESSRNFGCVSYERSYEGPLLDLDRHSQQSLN